jgi:hypothetical protein
MFTKDSWKFKLVMCLPTWVPIGTVSADGYKGVYFKIRFYGWLA